MAKQDWTPGSKVNVGGREYYVQGREDTAPKGLARAYILCTLDQSRQYRWRPFRGLELLNGELVRPRRRRVKAKGKTKGTRVAPRGGLWDRLKARFGMRVKPRRNSTIRRPPGAAISSDPRPT